MECVVVHEVVEPDEDTYYPGPYLSHIFQLNDTFVGFFSTGGIVTKMVFNKIVLLRLTPLTRHCPCLAGPVIPTVIIHCDMVRYQSWHVMIIVITFTDDKEHFVVIPQKKICCACT